MIKLILIGYSTKRDLNGNCYHKARIISTKTGKSLIIAGIPSLSNVQSFLRQNGYEWSDLYFEEVTGLTQKELKWIKEDIWHNCCNHKDKQLIKLIKDLHKKDKGESN